MHFEVFHRGLLGRPKVIAVDMIHHSGLWGLCFTHHPPHNNFPRYAADTTTASVLRFLEDAQNGVDGLSLSALADYTITTHHVDADAMLPVWMLLHPEEALERRAFLERIARGGDFFLYLDEESAKVNAVVEALHQRLRGEGMRGERLVHDDLTRRCFETLLPQMCALLDDPAPFAELWEPSLRALHADLDTLQQPGRVSEYWDCHLSLIETDHVPDTHALNTACRNDLLLVWRTDTTERRLDVRPALAWYEVTSMPHRPRYDLEALGAQLNAAEAEAGYIASWEYRPGPVSLETMDSKLSQETVLEVVRTWLNDAPMERISEVYRNDVRNVYWHNARHAVFDSHERFARAAALHFQPDQGYGGLYCLSPGKVEATPTKEKRQLFEAGKTPILFAVSDDFYWNRAAPEPLSLEVTYDDCGDGAFWLEYDAWNDLLRPTPQVALTGDGRTKSAIFLLADARFGNSQDSGADFRLARTPGTRLALRALRLSKHVGMEAQ